MFRNPNLARLLKAITKKGRDAFYKGPHAKAVVKFSDKNGGFFSLRDFADHKSEWVEPVSTNYRGYNVWELPPNGHRAAGRYRSRCPVAWTAGLSCTPASGSSR